MTYDCTEDINKHINRVRELLRKFRSVLYLRGHLHDASKLESPEKEAYDIMTPRLNSSAYGSDAYKATLREFQYAVDHHYANNSHHPEFHESGIGGMSLLDIVEMLSDWKAASERTKDGEIMKSIEISVKRFGIEPQLASVLRNTVKEMGW